MISNAKLIFQIIKDIQILKEPQKIKVMGYMDWILVHVQYVMLVVKDADCTVIISIRE